MAMVIPKGSVCMKKAGICTIVILVFAALAVWIYRSGNHDEKTPVQGKILVIWLGLFLSGV